MRAILLLAHGSREDATERTMEKIVEHIKSELSEEIAENDYIVKEAYLQFRNRNLSNVLDELLLEGADDIIIIPYFLFEGVHIKEDIPKEIEDFLSTHKNVKITMGNTLGSDRRLAEIIADNVRELI